jgi:hypothetical protein
MYLEKPERLTIWNGGSNKEVKNDLNMRNS